MPEHIQLSLDIISARYDVSSDLPVPGATANITRYMSALEVSDLPEKKDLLKHMSGKLVRCFSNPDLDTQERSVVYVTNFLNNYPDQKNYILEQIKENIDEIGNPSNQKDKAKTFRLFNVARNVILLANNAELPEHTSPNLRINRSVLDESRPAIWIAPQFADNRAAVVAYPWDVMRLSEAQMRITQEYGQGEGNNKAKRQAYATFFGVTEDYLKLRP